jgi:hypothetical protein
VGIDPGGGSEDDPARGGVEHAVDDDAVEVQVGIEVEPKRWMKATAPRRAAGPAPGLPARRQDSTARRNKRKAAPWSVASRSRK